jgi:cytidylate kinase
MSLITISRGSYRWGKEVGERVAEKLGYECIGRETITEASEMFSVPEAKLIKALHESPSILEKFTYEKEKYLTYLQVALLERFQKDNVVYHGLAGHFFLKDVKHLFKVRLTVDMEDRIKLHMETEGITREKAERNIRREDEVRRKWSQYLYGIDTWDTSLYDLVVHTTDRVDLSVDIICHMGKQYKTTPESQKVLDDLLIAARVKAALIDIKPDITVTPTSDDTITVETKAALTQEDVLVRKMKEAAESVAAGKKILVNVRPVLPY